MAEYSRALLLAKGIAEPGLNLPQQLERSAVSLSVDPDVQLADLTARVLLTTLRRLPGPLALHRGSLTPESIEELERVVSEVDPERPLRVLDTVPSGSIHLHVGYSPTAGAIRVIPEGYGGHIVRGATRVTPRRPALPLGAIYTAALGAGEAFKRMASVRDERRIDHEHLQFCPVSLTANLDSIGPLPPSLRADITLGGVGAVGTAIALILAELDIYGQALLIDKQRYAPENRGTYSLGGATEVKNSTWKTAVGAQALEGRFEVTEFRDDVDQLIEGVDRRDFPHHPYVLSAFDNVPARRHIQRLWPDHLIDAATGDTMVGFRDVVAEEGPCLMCFLPDIPGGESSAAVLSRHTGLSVERVGYGDLDLTEADLDALSSVQQRRLRPHVGKKVCGLAKALGLTDLQADGYEPSVPFVSLQAACLAVGRFIRRLLKIACHDNFVQYDALIGPTLATIEGRRRVEDCYCHRHSDTIRKVRLIRSGPR